MGVFSVLPDTWEEIKSALKQICEQNNTDCSTTLSNAIETVTDPHPTQDPPYQRAAKRARLDEDSDYGKTSPLRFPPELLDTAINEEMDPNEIPDIEPRSKPPNLRKLT
ncbi:hypothetical protein NW762_003086 [Fusarium torreyae]|uniref:Uncharacterized protein n=1 Tax=Fusarium torreyae TaxID=1237075 RepID=A0A9W8VHD3_9HYPO|nr:hypothetical protein NW762_003086 [Fusarium torreyae]